MLGLQGLSASADLGMENIYFCSLATPVWGWKGANGAGDSDSLSILCPIRAMLAGVG